MEVALESPLIAYVNQRLDAGDFLSLNSLADAGKPFVVSLLSQISHRPVLVVTDGLKSQEAFYNDLQTFLPDAQFYPAWETLPHEDQLPHVATITDRLKALNSVVAAVYDRRGFDESDSAVADRRYSSVILPSVRAL